MKGYTMMKNKENIIGFDFQGWPVRKITLEEIIQHLGATYNEETGNYEIKKDNLQITPLVLTDDGMGYGVEDSYIVDVDKTDDDCRIWIDVPDRYIDIYLEDDVQPGMTVTTPDGSKIYIVNCYVPVCNKYNASEFKKGSEKLGEPEYIDRNIVAEWSRQKNQKWRENGEENQ